jgi:ABC-type sugar transport system ATPase subunit
MRAGIKLLHQNLGTTFIFVTHDQVEAMTLADKIVLLNDGKIEQIGSPEEIYQHPASIFAGSFIGSPPMNFIKLSSTLMSLLGIEGRLPSGATGIEHLAAGIRPEALRFSREPNQVVLAAECDFFESIGPYYLYYFKLPAEEMLSGHLIVTSIEKISLPQRQSARLFLNLKDIAFFDRQTGRRVGPLIA